jgi:hypothetical protein
MSLRQYITAFVLLAGLPACKRDADSSCSPGSQNGTVVHGRNQCDQNGYVIQLDGGPAYSPDELPVSFQQDGLKVCLTYTVYEDPRMCPCCGGTRVKIQQIARR